MGVRQQRLLEADESGAALARGEEAYVRWKETRSTAVAEASRPSIQVQTVTTFAAGASLAELDFAFSRLISVNALVPIFLVRAGSARSFLPCSPTAVFSPLRMQLGQWLKQMGGLWARRPRRFFPL